MAPTPEVTELPLTKRLDIMASNASEKVTLVGPARALYLWMREMQLVELGAPDFDQVRVVVVICSV